MLANLSDSLLLFTQNVRKVSVYHLSENAQPSDAKLLISVTKEPIKYIREYIVNKVREFLISCGGLI